MANNLLPAVYFAAIWLLSLAVRVGFLAGLREDEFNALTEGRVTKEAFMEEYPIDWAITLAPVFVLHFLLAMQYWNFANDKRKTGGVPRWIRAALLLLSAYLCFDASWEFVLAHWRDLAYVEKEPGMVELQKRLSLNYALYWIPVATWAAVVLGALAHCLRYRKSLPVKGRDSQ